MVGTEGTEMGIPPSAPVDPSTVLEVVHRPISAAVDDVFAEGPVAGNTHSSRRSAKACLAVHSQNATTSVIAVETAKALAPPKCARYRGKGRRGEAVDVHLGIDGCRVGKRAGQKQEEDGEEYERTHHDDDGRWGGKDRLWIEG